VGCILLVGALLLLVMAGGAVAFVLFARTSAVMSAPVPPSTAPTLPAPPMPVSVAPAPTPPPRALPAAPADPLGGVAADPAVGAPIDPSSIPGLDPVVTPDSAEVRGSLDREVIRRVIRRHIGAVQRCYEQGLAADPTLAGRVVVSFIISPTGAVPAATVSESSLSGPRSEAVTACIVTQVRTWTFPAPDGGGTVSVNYPFVFTSSP
jgi:TonB family protein